MHEREERCIKILVGKTQVKRPSSIPRCNRRLKWMGTGWEAVDWVHVPEDRGKWWAPVNTVMNHQAS
jgi:hypothetical protein